MKDKKIARIYYDAQVFLTKTGELYGYVILNDGRPRCDKLTAQQKIAFWKSRGINHSENLVPWQPVSDLSGAHFAAEMMHYQEKNR